MSVDDYAGAEAGGAGMGSRVARGLGWSGTSVVALQVSRFVFAIVLARLLTPHEYGLAAMALVFMALVLLVSDLTLGVGLVQRPRITEADRSTVFWTSVAIGALLTAAGIAAAGPVAGFYGEPRVRPLLAVLSLSFVVIALGRTHAALLHRAMNFRAMALRVIAATVLGGVVGIALAVAGYGPWALIAQHMTNAIVTTVLLWVSASWYPKLVFSTRSVVELGRFGLRFFGTKLSEYFNSNVDKVLIGKVLGSSSLAVYTMAANLILVPIASLLVAVVDTLFPALSRLQSAHDRVAEAWVRGTRVLATGMAPIALGLVVVAPDLVPLLLGEQWLRSVPVVQILAFAALVQGLTVLSATVLTAIDRMKLLLRFSIAESFAIAVGIVAGVQYGVVGVAAAVVAVTLVTRTLLVRLAARAVGIPARSVASACVGALQAGVVMAIGVEAARVALVDVGVGEAVRVALLVPLGLALYVPLALWRAPEAVAEVRGLGRKMRRPRIAVEQA